MTATRPLFAAAKPGRLDHDAVHGRHPGRDHEHQDRRDGQHDPLATRAQDERDEREHERERPDVVGALGQDAPEDLPGRAVAPEVGQHDAEQAARRTGGAGRRPACGASRSSERARSSTNGTSMTAASAAPAAARGAERQQPQRQAAAQVLGRQRADEHEHRRDDERPGSSRTGGRRGTAGRPRARARRPAAAPGVAGSARPAATSTATSAHTDIVGHATQVTDQRLKPKTSPASSAPPWRIPSSRPSRYVPKAATKSLSTAMTPSAVHRSRT